VTTQVDVINSALIDCEQPEASGPNDTSTWVRRVRNRYAPTAKKLLERHPWNFAMTRVQLQDSGVEPIGRDFSYTKPADCLRIVTLNTTGNADENSTPDYEDEAGYILCDLDPCYLRYVSANFLTKEGAWPQVFADAVSSELAAKCYGVFGKSATKKEELKKDAAKALQAAKSWDAAQQPFRRLPRGRWASSRAGASWPRSAPEES
jgi:hypothetical protein